MQDYLKELARIKAEQDKLAVEREANQDKAFAVNTVGAIGDALANQQSFGNYWLGQMNPKNNVASNLNAVAKRVEGRTKNREDELARSKELFDKYQMMKAQGEQDFNNQKELQKLKNAGKIGAAKEKSVIDASKQKEEQDLKQQALYVPGLGYAQTSEDAKKLKDGIEMKSKFDRQVGEMIDLRKEYGGEAWNSEAVARGKQLSKDLLLTYKNLAKLGVLSKADEAIINAIVPADPLEFTPLSAIRGQDPIMAQLEKFKGDIEDDYSTTLKTRLQNGFEVANQVNPGGQGGANRVLPEAKASIKIGQVQDGYKFIGGDPADPKSWEKVK